MMKLFDADGNVPLHSAVHAGMSYYDHLSFNLVVEG